MSQHYANMWVALSGGVLLCAPTPLRDLSTIVTLARTYGRRRFMKEVSQSRRDHARSLLARVGGRCGLRIEEVEDTSLHPGETRKVKHRRSHVSDVMSGSLRARTGTCLQERRPSCSSSGSASPHESASGGNRVFQGMMSSTQWS